MFRKSNAGIISFCAITTTSAVILNRPRLRRKTSPASRFRRFRLWASPSFDEHTTASRETFFVFGQMYETRPPEEIFLPRLFMSVKSSDLVRRCTRAIAIYGISFFLPLFLRRLKTFLPPEVFIFALNPLCFLSLLTFGLKAGFIGLRFYLFFLLCQ